MRNLLLALTVLFFSIASYSQSNYSQYGIGQINTEGLPHNAGSANAFLVSNDSISANLLNTASLSNLKYTTFNLGVSSSLINIKNQSSSASNTNTAFQNFSLSFPVIKNHWGTSFGVLPFSNAKSSSSFESINNLLGTVNTTYKSEGGLNKIYFANGFGYKGASVGVNLGYIIGNITNTITSDYLNDDALSAQEYNKNIYKGTNLEYSFQYVKTDSSKNTYGIGAVLSSQTDLSGSSSFLESTYSEDFNFIIDTLSQSSSNFNFIVPQKLSTGGFYSFNNPFSGSKFNLAFLKLGVKYSSQNWSDNKILTTNPKFKNNTNYAFGLEFAKNPKGAKNQLRQAIYSLGYKYSDGNLSFGTDEIAETGITFGVQLPVKPRFSKTSYYSGMILNFGLELGQRGTTNNNLFEENYAKLFLGITFNDTWFLKQQYD